jgi:hypothetical protein
LAGGFRFKRPKGQRPRPKDL